MKPHWRAVAVGIAVCFAGAVCTLRFLEAVLFAPHKPPEIIKTASSQHYNAEALLVEVSWSDLSYSVRVRQIGAPIDGTEVMLIFDVTAGPTLLNWRADGLEITVPNEFHYEKQLHTVKVGGVDIKITYKSPPPY